jgi:hypothetical protein
VYHKGVRCIIKTSGISSRAILGQRDDGQYREKIVAKVYVFEGEYALRDSMSFA